MRPARRLPSTLALALLLASGLLPASPAPARELEVQRVWPGYRSAESFARIGEYFGFRPNPARRTVVRTRADDRGGFYWLVRTKADHPHPRARVELQVILPGQDRATTHVFATPLPVGSHATLVGLTGEDWPGKNVRPLAWKLRLLGAEDQELATTTSFLWSHPVAPDPQP